MRPAEALADPAGGDPIADRELAALFKPLAKARRVAIAVSGGADSLALLDCIDRWRKTRGRPDVVVLTVDHRLRRGSGRAAMAVKAIAEQRGLPVRVLVRRGKAPVSGIEAAARRARYRLLFEACGAGGISHLAVAHHRDDVAETFLMRLKRGAGLFGLAAMRPAIPVGDVTLVRPFLAVPRARLQATTAAAGLTPVDDPMNRDPRFARTAIRRLLSGGDLDPALLAALAMRFAGLADKVDAQANAFIAASVSVDAFAVAWLDRARFAEAGPDVQGRVLARILIAVGASEYAPRSDRLSALQAAILGIGKDMRLKRTLGGVVVEGCGGRIAFYRETGRLGPPPVAVEPGHAGVWDGRFAVAVGDAAPAGLTLGPLGEEGRREVGATSAKLALPAPAGAIAALPAIRRGRKIVATPVFRDGPATFRSILGERLLTPPLFPDFGAK